MKHQGKENGQSGFTIVEVTVTLMLMMVISATAIFMIQPSLQNAKCDAAMKQVVDQIRQAREYAITNRRYIQISFPTVGNRPEVVITQMNTLTPGAGPVNQVLRPGESHVARRLPLRSKTSM